MLYVSFFSLIMAPRVVPDIPVVAEPRQIMFRYFRFLVKWLKHPSKNYIYSIVRSADPADLYVTPEVIVVKQMSSIEMTIPPDEDNLHWYQHYYRDDHHDYFTLAISSDARQIIKKFHGPQKFGIGGDTIDKFAADDALRKRFLCNRIARRHRAVQNYLNDM